MIFKLKKTANKGILHHIIFCLPLEEIYGVPEKNVAFVFLLISQNYLTAAKTTVFIHTLSNKLATQNKAE